MKKKLCFLALLSSSTLLFYACQKDEKILELVTLNQSQRLTFYAIEDITKTALEAKDEEVSYTWKNTDNSYLVFYQNEEVGTNPEIEVDEYGKAIFSATFQKKVAPFKYKALIAGNKSSTNESLPKVPAEQKPADNSFDPAADILVGKTTSEVAEQPTKVEMYFKRVVVMGRIALESLPEGEKMESVSITSAGKKLAGNATSIDYANGTCEFGESEGDSQSITMQFDDKNVSGTFNSYFVACPVGGVSALTVKVITDKYIRIKTINATKPIGFNIGSFVSIELDMAGANVTSRERPEGSISLVSTIENNCDYVIVNYKKDGLMQNNKAEDEGYGQTIGFGTLINFFTLSDDILTPKVDDISSVVWKANTSLVSGLSDYFSFVNSGTYLYGIESGTTPRFYNIAPTADQSVNVNISETSTKVASPYFKYESEGNLLMYKVVTDGEKTRYFYGTSSSWQSTSSTSSTDRPVYLFKVISSTLTPVTGVTVSGETSVMLNQQVQLTATVAPAAADISDVFWSVVEGAEYASVNSSGLVTGNSLGSATIRATAVDNPTIYGDYNVEVYKVSVTGVTVTGESSSVFVDKTVQLTATVDPSNADDQTVTWSVVSGPEYASVDASGLVTGLAKGNATIRATSNDNSAIFGEYSVKVVKPVSYTLITATSYTDYSNYTVGGKYLIVSADKKHIMWCNNESLADFADFTCADNTTIQLDEDVASTYEWTSYERWDNYTDEKDNYPGRKLKNGNYYMYRSGSTLLFGESDGNTKYYNWGYNGEQLHCHKDDYCYIYYNNAGNWVMTNPKEGETCKAYLFKKVTE